MLNTNEEVKKLVQTGEQLARNLLKKSEFIEVNEIKHGFSLLIEKSEVE